LVRPAQFIAEKKPAIVYVVTNREGKVLEIANPRVSGDTVLGTSAAENLPVALPLSEVYRVAALRPHGGRTALLVAGVTAAAGIVAYAFVQNAAGRNNWSCDYNTPALDGAGAPSCGPTAAAGRP